MKKTFIIEYSAYDKKGVLFKSGKMKAKNRVDKLEAQCMFEKFLEKRYPDFNRLVVHRCDEDRIASSFGDVFGDIFK